MPPRNRSSSYSRSPKRNKRYRNHSQSSSSRHKSKNNRVEREPPELPVYDINAKSDLKHHVRYTKIPVRTREDREFIMDEVKNVLEDSFGKVSVITKLEETSNYLSLGVGFKYDKDALYFIKECGYINSKLNGVVLEAVPTPSFQQIIPMIKEAQKIEKEKIEKEKAKEKLRSHSLSKRHRKRSFSSERPRKKRSRSRSPYREDRKRRSRSRSQKRKRQDEKTIWMFGLPSTIKGREVGDYLLHRHPSGPFHINNWTWVRLKNSNCEFMELILDSHKADKLLKLNDQASIEGCSCIMVSANGPSSQQSVREVLKDYQLRLTFPDRVYPENVVSAMKEVCGVVQVVSCSRLLDGRSDSYVVTLASAAKAKELKRLNLRQAKIAIEDSKGQLVYRPTKLSKLCGSN